MIYCTFRPYLPGVPGSEPLLAQAWKLSGLIERDTVIYVGASEFGQLVREVIEGAKGDVPPGTPTSLRFGKSPCAHIINAGTDHRETVAAVNRNTPGAVDFQAKAKRLQVRSPQEVPTTFAGMPIQMANDA